MKNEFEYEGVVHNAFFTRATRKENVKTYWGSEKGDTSRLFDYSINEKGEIVIIKKR